ncbi:Uncharacterised protein [Actinobacillus equuli]|nr:Uncharacterised protein [Actinobacillus equuli]
MFIGTIPQNNLTKQEQTLLDDYRESNEQGKEAIEKTAKALAFTQSLAAREVA